MKIDNGKSPFPFADIHPAYLGIPAPGGEHMHRVGGLPCIGGEPGFHHQYSALVQMLLKTDQGLDHIFQGFHIPDGTE